jgi:hypothetical protein
MAQTQEISSSRLIKEAGLTSIPAIMLSYIKFYGIWIECFEGSTVLKRNITR